jgi:hypothetical protein
MNEKSYIGLAAVCRYFHVQYVTDILKGKSLKISNVLRALVFIKKAVVLNWH